MNLAKFRTLHFREMDFDRYPCLRMAFDSGRAGQSAPTVFNAANEIAVARFLEGQISFLDIERVIESVLNRHQIVDVPDVESIVECRCLGKKRSIIDLTGRFSCIGRENNDNLSTGRYEQEARTIRCI